MRLIGLDRNEAMNVIKELKHLGIYSRHEAKDCCVVVDPKNTDEEKLVREVALEFDCAVN